MSRYRPLPLVPSLALALALALALVLAFVALRSPAAHATHVPVEVAIDMDVTGNGDNVLGPTESCNTTPLQVGETIEIDVVVRGVPPPSQVEDPVWPYRDGIVGFGFNLLFDPAVVQVTEVLAADGPTILSAVSLGGVFSLIDYDGDAYAGSGNEDPPPGVGGNVRVDVSDIGGQAESGDGVLTRIVLTSVGEGVTVLLLSDLASVHPSWPGEDGLPDVFDWAPDQYEIGAVGQGQVVVGGGSCPATPPPLPATPTPPPGPPSATPPPLPGASTPPPLPAATPTPSPGSPFVTPVPTLVGATGLAPAGGPAALPRTGGKPDRSGSGLQPLLAVGIALAVVCAGLGALHAVRRRAARRRR